MPPHYEVLPSVNVVLGEARPLVPDVAVVTDTDADPGRLRLQRPFVADVDLTVSGH
jgi:hypothetical protein